MPRHAHLRIHLSRLRPHVRHRPEDGGRLAHDLPALRRAAPEGLRGAGDRVQGFGLLRDGSRQGIEGQRRHEGRTSGSQGRHEEGQRLVGEEGSRPVGEEDRRHEHEEGVVLRHDGRRRKNGPGRDDGRDRGLRRFGVLRVPGRSRGDRGRHAVREAGGRRHGGIDRGTARGVHPAPRQGPRVPTASGPVPRERLGDEGARRHAAVRSIGGWFAPPGHPSAYLRRVRPSDRLHEVAREHLLRRADHHARVVRRPVLPGDASGLGRRRASSSGSSTASAGRWS